MDLATVMSIVQTLLTAIQTSNHFKEILSHFSSKSKLDSLQDTLSTVLSVLEDAEAKQDALNSQEKNYVEKLKDAVYDADDVLDEFFTLVHQNRLTVSAANDFTGKVKSFFSQFKPVTIKLSRKIKKVNKKLDCIVRRSEFSFKVDYRPRQFKKEDTSCFLSSNDDIIGREDDVRKVLGMLLDSDVEQPDVCFVSIVGMGGLGKTALAQLIFNDLRLKDANLDFKSWTCIADQDQKEWNPKELLRKVLNDLPTGKKGLTSLQQMEKELRNQLTEKKYLLVLDDVWTEDFDRLVKMKGFFMGGRSGSRVLVTTRSKKTAERIANTQVHELKGLSEKKSWDLFKRMAVPTDNLEEIGRAIIKHLVGVPLAIRVVGSLLRDQLKGKWQEFQEKGLANISDYENNILNILKLSYYQLDPNLRSCFTYCALFPKDFEIEKQMLIKLWMAQGYINKYNDGEDYFLILLQRCFFQDLLRDKHDEIVKCKLHDLWHDIAEQATGKEICKADLSTINLGERVRHVYFPDNTDMTEILCKTHIRTLLQLCDYWNMRGNEEFFLGKLFDNWSCLRTLTLRGLDAISLPESIGKLLHLRYLDLTSNYKLEKLPNSITKLHNLQCLILYGCRSLKEWPKDMRKLVNISTLHITHCESLSNMPLGLGKLTGLHTLSNFIVGQPSPSERQCFDGLEDLKALNSLRGSLEISLQVEKNAKYMKENHGGGAYLRYKEHLNSVCIKFLKGEGYGSIEEEESLLEELQPHTNCKDLVVEGYNGLSMPSWPGSEGDSSSNLPNLVCFEIVNCDELRRCLPSLWKLSCLRELKLSRLPKVEYLVSDCPKSVEYLSYHHLPSLVHLSIFNCAELRCLGSVSKLPCLRELELRGLSKLKYLTNDSHSTSYFFPSLEVLHIDDLPELNGWWPEMDQSDNSKDGEGSSSQERDRIIWTSVPSLSLLKKLSITNTPKMQHRSPKMQFVPVSLCPVLENFLYLLE